MLAIRRMEEASAKAYAQGKIGGFLHLDHRPGGGVRRRDRRARSRTTTSSRPIASTATPTPRAIAAQAILAELYGKKTGCVEGPRRLDAPVRRRARTSSAATASSAATCRSRPASRSRRSTAATARVTLCFFGDGASPHGAFHEGVALAALWKLPVVFICENNQYSMGTPLYRSLAVEDVSQQRARLRHGARSLRRRRRRHGARPHRRGGRARAQRPASRRSSRS